VTLTRIVDGYFEMWNETDPVRRRAVIAATWAPGAGHVDPMFAADGHDALDAMVAAVHGHRRLSQLELSIRAEISAGT
jgi:hypothetical protein